MRSVTRICVEALSWAEIPAVQKGNVIEISTGKVGVGSFDETGEFKNIRITTTESGSVQR